MPSQDAETKLKNLPTDASLTAQSVVMSKPKSTSLELLSLIESIADVRRDLLEITGKLKDGISSVKRDFSHESQRISDADKQHNTRVNGLVRRIDQLEADVQRLDELTSATGQKLSGVSMKADSAHYAAESNSAFIEALNSSVDLLNAQVKELKLNLEKLGKKSLTIRWISVIGMLSIVGIFGIFRVLALPDTAHLEEIQEQHQQSITDIVDYLSR